MDFKISDIYYQPQAFLDHLENFNNIINPDILSQIKESLSDILESDVETADWEFLYTFLLTNLDELNDVGILCYTKDEIKLIDLGIFEYGIESIVGGLETQNDQFNIDGPENNLQNWNKY